MVDFMVKLSLLESILMLLGIGIFYLIAGLNKPLLPGDAGDAYLRNLRFCRRWSIGTIPAAWAMSLFCGPEAYLNHCQTLGQHCGWMGEIWMMAALLCLVANGVLLLAGRKRYREDLAKITASTLVGGMLFALMSVLLVGG